MEKKSYKISPPIVIGKTVYDIKHFLLPKYTNKFLEGVLIPEGLIKSRLERLAYDIVNYYQGVPFTLIPLLKGSSRVFEDLITLLRNYVEIGCYDFDL